MLPSTLLALSLLRFVKFFTDINHVNTYINNFINSSKRASSQVSFININRILSRSKGPNNYKAIELNLINRRISSTAIFKKFFYVLIVFSFIRLITNKLNLKFKPPNVDFDFLLPLLLFQIQNPYKSIPYLLTYLSAITNRYSVS